jgi:hypothetical protein
METVTGILPFLIKLVECPGHGQEKKELVKNAMLAILDKLNIKIPFIDFILSALIDGLVEIMFPKKEE